MLISIIIPIYNEENNIQPLYTKLQETMGKCEFAWEVIFINDGSLDSSGQKLGSPDIKPMVQKYYGVTSFMTASCFRI